MKHFSILKSMIYYNLFLNLLWWAEICNVTFCCLSIKMKYVFRYILSTPQNALIHFQPIPTHIKTQITAWFHVFLIRSLHCISSTIDNIGRMRGRWNHWINLQWLFDKLYIQLKIMVIWHGRKRQYRILMVFYILMIFI